MDRVDAVRKRLQQFGYEAKENDNFVLSFSLEKVLNTVKNETHNCKIPKQLECIVVDMAAGEFLMAKKTFAPDSLGMLDLGLAVKQLQEGDTNTVFAIGEGVMTDEQRLNAFINHLLTYGKSEIYHYRRLKW